MATSTLNCGFNSRAGSQSGTKRQGLAKRPPRLGHSRQLHFEPLERRCLLDGALGPDTIELFADSFENGQWNDQWVEDSQNDWFTSTQRATDGSYSSEVDGKATDATLTVASPIDLTPYGSAELTFDWYIESGFDSGEYLALDFFDGTTWQEEVAKLSGNVDQENTWHHETVAIDYLVDNFQIRFRGKANRSNEDGNVDNVHLVATPTGPLNQPPVATGEDYDVVEDNTLDVIAPAGVLLNDTDPDDDDTLTAELLDPATYGTVTLESDGSFRYDPDSNFHGTDSFTYRAYDGSAYSNPATVTIDVASVPDGPPVADAGGPYQVMETQTPTLEWIQQFGTSEWASSVSTDWLGNVYIAARTDGGDAFVSKYDASGTLEWTRQFGSSETDDPSSVFADGQGNVYISGLTYGNLGEGQPNAGSADAFVSKYDAFGNHWWTRQLGTAGFDYATGVSADGSGNVYISGYTEGSLGDEQPNAGGEDAFIAKYNTLGEHLWTRQLGTSETDMGYGVSADGLGNVYISGFMGGTGDFDSGSHAFLAKYHADGGHQWTQQLGTSETDRGYDVSADGLGNVYISGSTKGSLGGTNPNPGVSDAFVAKYDTLGEHLWTRQLGTSAQDVSLEVSADGLGNVYIAGFTSGSLGGPYAGGSYDVFLAKYDASGALQWTQQIGTSESDLGHGVSADGLGNVYVSGETTGSLGGPNAGGYEAFVARFSEVSSIVLDASGTTDLDLPYETLTYEWDFDDDSSYDDATGAAPVFYANGSPGEMFTVGLRVTDSEGNWDTDTANVTIVPTPVTETYGSTHPPLVIPDLGSVVSTIDVSDSYTIADLTVQIDIDHPRPIDLTITLTSPVGTEISLPPTGGSGESFASQRVGGTWTLNVTDGKTRKEGTLYSWSMIVTPAAGGGSSSYSLPPLATVGSTTEPAESIASLRNIESPRVRSTERPVSADRLHLLLRSERETQEPSAALDRRGLANQHVSNTEAIDLALTELEESLLDGHLAQLLAANWNKQL